MRREALTVKLRYKRPGETESIEFASVAAYGAGPIESASPDLRFAAAIAEFSLTLRSEKDKDASNYAGAITRLSDAIGDDPDGREAELMYLMKAARGLVTKE